MNGSNVSSSVGHLKLSRVSFTMNIYKNLDENGSQSAHSLSKGGYYSVLPVLKRTKCSKWLTAYFPVSRWSSSLSQGRSAASPSLNLSWSVLVFLDRVKPLLSTPVLHPWDVGQWPNSPYQALPWHLKPLGRGTPIFPCLCVICHTISKPVAWSLYLSFSVKKKKSSRC